MQRLGLDTEHVARRRYEAWAAQDRAECAQQAAQRRGDYATAVWALVSMLLLFLAHAAANDGRMMLTVMLGAPGGAMVLTMSRAPRWVAGLARRVREVTARC